MTLPEMRIEDRFYARTAQFNNRFGTESVSNNNEDSESFQNVLKQCIDDVNQKTLDSNAATDSFIKGEDISIEDVMMKATEANLSLQFLTTTRDKLVEGYKELIKMSV